VNELNDIPKALNNQVEEIKNHISKLMELPQTLEESAKSYGAIVRQRTIKCAANLLLALFVYASSRMSIRALAASAAVMGVADISDQAWQKKFITLSFPI